MHNRMIERHRAAQLAEANFAFIISLIGAVLFVLYILNRLE